MSRKAIRKCGGRGQAEEIVRNREGGAGGVKEAKEVPRQYHRDKAGAYSSSSKRASNSAVMAIMASSACSPSTSIISDVPQGAANINNAMTLVALARRSPWLTMTVAAKGAQQLTNLVAARACRPRLLVSVSSRLRIAIPIPLRICSIERGMNTEFTVAQADFRQ